MDYLDYEIEDFLSDSGFCNYCLGKDRQDMEFWNEWIRVHPEKKEVVSRARELYYMLNGNHTLDQFEKDAASFREAFENHLAETPHAQTTMFAERRPNSGRSLLRYSTALCAAAVLIMVFLDRHPHDTVAGRAKTGFVSASPSGVRKKLRLPDGSTVILNSASRLSITGGFGDSLRQVSLQGEGYFDIAHDPQHPFIIHTAAMDIHVLGTTVDVKAYPDDAVEETALISGSVEVFVKDGANRRILLRPDEKIDIPNPAIGEPLGRRSIVSQKRHVLSIEKLTVATADSVAPEVSWTVDCLTFSDKPLDEIATQLERWYNVSIRFDDERVKKFRYTATFDKKTISQVLRALSMSQPFSYTWEGQGKIVIRSAPMKD